jgi:hypothetical protein
MNKQAALDFQDRWLRLAGVFAIFGALLFGLSIVLSQVASGDNDAERLTSFHQHSQQLIISEGILVAVPFFLFTLPLWVLIRSVQFRTDRVRRWLAALAFIGPILFGISNLALVAGLDDVSGKFVDQAPAKAQAAEQHAAAAQSSAAKTAPKGKTPTTTTTTTTATPEQAAANAKDDFAKDLINDSSTLKTGAILRFVGLLAVVFAMVYFSLWAMRVGLLTRFWGTFGMAAGASLILVPFGVLLVAFWFAVLGLMFVGRWVQPMPPAWAAGEAIPWPRRDQIGPSPESGTVEGSGREVSEEPAENGDAAAQLPTGESQGQRRKKRKRRS